MANETKAVKQAFEARVSSELLTAASIAVHFQGKEFDPTSINEWYAPRLTGYTGSPARLNARTEFWTVDINCFTKSRIGSDIAHRVWELADLAIAAFNQVTLSVGSPVIGYLRFDEGDINPLPSTGFHDEDTKVLQLNVSFNPTLII